MCEKNFVLFIGGSKDGQLIAMIDLKQEMRFPIYDPVSKWLTEEEYFFDPPKTEYETYYLHKLAVGTHCFVMIINDMLIEEAMYVLLTHYKRNSNDAE